MNDDMMASKTYSWLLPAFPDISYPLPFLRSLKPHLFAVPTASTFLDILCPDLCVASFSPFSSLRKEN